MAGGRELIGVGLRGVRRLLGGVGGGLQFGDGGVEVFHHVLTKARAST